MTTATKSPPKQELQTVPFSVPSVAFDVSMQQIAELRAEYMSLTITDVNDKEQIAAVNEARGLCKKLRVGTEKIGKAARDGFNKAAKDVITQERSLTDPISEIETHLEGELAKVKAEEVRKKREVEEKRQAVIRDRLNALAACGKVYLADDVADLSGEDFGQLLASEQADKQARDEQAAAAKAEQERIFAQQRDEQLKLAEERRELDRQRAEAETRNKRALARVQMLMQLGYIGETKPDQLADMAPANWEDLLRNAQDEKRRRDNKADIERAEIERVKAEQAAAQAKIDAENKRIADEEAERLRRAEIAKAQEEAAEQARLDAIAETERKEREAKAEAERQAAELARLESLRPDHEKLLAVETAIYLIVVPDVGPEAKAAAEQISAALRYAARDVRGICDDLVARKK